MNVVIYARYSSHNQTEQSIEGQLKTCYEYAKNNNYIVIDEYIDRALTGTNDNRPQFLKMIEDSNKKQFQGVLVYQLDRFSRNRYDSATYKNKLKKNGVRVFSARENISDDASGVLMESVLEGMAEYYSKELSQKVKRGLKINASKCLFTGGSLPFGYKIVDKKFEIDETKAFIVKKIFELYSDGYTIKKIIEYLKNNGYKNSQGKDFTKSPLSIMLKNRRYMGIYIFNGVETPEGIPRIISDELFNKVADRMNINKKAPARTRAKEEYILSTKLFCGYCKSLMTGFCGTSRTGKVYNYYACTNSRLHVCNKKNVKKQYIEDLVVNQCLSLLTNENIDKIAKTIIEISEKEEDTTHIKYLNKLLNDNQKATENLLRALEKGDLSDIVTDRLLQKKQEKIQIEKEIEDEENNKINLSITDIKFFLNQLKNGQIDDIKYRRMLISVFINKIYLYDDKITITFNINNREVTIDDSLLNEIENNCSGSIINCIAQQIKKLETSRFQAFILFNKFYLFICLL